jgi:hypothetical protein
MESNLSAFSKEFLDLVKDNAAMNQRTVEQQLTDDVIEYIKEEGFAISPELITISNQEVCKPTAPEFYKINAFDYSEEAGILDLFITNYIESESIPELTKSKIQLFQNQIIRFLSFSLTSNSFLAKLKEEQPEAAEIVETIITEFKNKHVNLVRFFIISNGLKKIDVVLDQEITLGAFTFDCEFQIWDIETIRRSDLASRAEGAIDIDFPNLYDHPIDCLELEETNGVKSYLAIMPAVILAKVFGEYKARLLNQNVRNYLGGKIKVNRGMADTLRNSPGLFFAYNNGISSTANEVKIIRDEETGKCTITNIRNWQIVNGGQTTNTIYSIYTKDKDLLSKAFVTMKLSEIRQADDIERARTISNIARFANSQTQIKESDLSANIDYMVKLQEFSRTEWVPASSVRRGTQWFFERMRGQYEMEAGDKKTKKYKQFVAEHPKKTQRFLKTDVAKWEMAWHEEPFTSSKGGEQCYDIFYKIFLKNDSLVVDKDYYHNLIAKAILYQSIAQINKELGIKAYINIICNYVLATLSVKSKKQLDLDYIWEHQDIHPDLRDWIIKASEIVKLYIDSLTQGGDNPTVKAKNATFWKNILLRMANMPELSRNVIKVKVGMLSDAQKEKYKEFEAISVELWRKLAEWARTTKKLSLVERKRIDHIITYKETGKNIIFDNANSGMEILSKAQDLGFVK